MSWWICVYRGLAGSDGDKKIAANKESNNIVGASGSEEPGVAELLRSLMAKMDAQAQAEKMDAQAWEFREAVQKGLGVVSNEARQFAEELCGGIKAELLHEVRDVRAGAQEVKEEVAALDEWGRVMREEVAALEEAGRAMKGEMASLRQAVMQQTSYRQSDEGAAFNEEPARCAPLTSGWCNSTTSAPTTALTPPSSPPPPLTGAWPPHWEKEAG